MDILLKGQFPYALREAMQVAYALAAEVKKNQPVVLLSVSSKNPGNQVFRFQGGVVTYIEMFDIGDQRQKWAVTGAHVRTRTGKITFTPDDLLALKKKGKFWTFVQDLSEIEKSVVVFHNGGAGEAYYNVDPESWQQGYFSAVRHVKYRPYVRGSLEAAEKEADKEVKRLTTNNVVALFGNNASGEYDYIVNPEGNYKGSKYYPLSFMGEISFDPNVEGSKEAAIEKAALWVEESYSSPEPSSYEDEEG